MRILLAILVIIAIAAKAAAPVASAAEPCFTYDNSTGVLVYGVPLKQKLLGAPKPGYRYEYGIHAEANRQNVKSSACPVYVQVGSIVVGIAFEPGAWDWGIYLWAEDTSSGQVLAKEHLGDMGPAKAVGVDGAVTVEMDCDGNVKVKVEAMGKSFSTSFWAGSESPKVYAIVYKVDGGLLTAGCESYVEFQKKVEVEKCNPSNITNYYDEPSKSANDPVDPADIVEMVKKAAAAMLMVVFIGLGLLILAVAWTNIGPLKGFKVMKRRR